MLTLALRTTHLRTPWPVGSSGVGHTISERIPGGGRRTRGGSRRPRVRGIASLACGDVRLARSGRAHIRSAPLEELRSRPSRRSADPQTILRGLGQTDGQRQGRKLNGRYTDAERKRDQQLPWILSSANLVQSRKNARFHPNLMAHSLKNQAYFSPSHTLIRKISRRGAEFSHPIDAKPCWSPCPWTRSPSHAWPAKIRFALSLGYNVCMSWQKNPGTCSTKPFLRATQR